MTTPTPVIPPIPAGTVVTAEQLNQLAAAAQFLAARPTVMATGGQATFSAVNEITTVTFGTILVDTDGMTDGAATSLFTVQRQGLYDVAVWGETGTAASAAALSAAVYVTAGPNNPAAAQGADLFALAGAWARNVWATGIAGYGTLALETGGILPGVLYPGDQIFVAGYSSQAGLSVSDCTVRITWAGGA